MTTTAPVYSARILGTPDIPVSIRDDSGSLTLDSSRAPHVQGSVTLSVEDASLLEDLDPRDNRRLVIDVSGRSFDLGIREANPNRSDATVAVQLASDEALLSDFAQLVDDMSAFDLAGSLRAVVSYALDKIDATLDAGPDADLSPVWDATNVLLNPNVVGSIANWSAANASITYGSGAGANGVSGYLISTAASASWQVRPVASTSFTDAVQVSPGRWYTFPVEVRSPQSPTARATIAWYDERGNVVGYANGATVPMSAAWARLFVTGQAPYNAVKAAPYVQCNGVSGNAMHLDQAMFYEGRFLVPYHDGATADTSLYEYEWTGTANASTSTRTALIDAPDPDAFVWLSGQSALAFLSPLVQVAGLRLVCDERRHWTLRNAEYRAEGGLTFRYGVNLIDASETLSREGEDWYDGAVVRYRSRVGGLEMTRDDTFALTDPPSKVVLREIDAAYPGPGRAEYMVRRAQGKGRTVTATVQATWAETAEQPLTTTLEGTPIQTGVANQVEFDLATNEVTVTSRTTDTPAAAWILIASGERWIDSPTGESWTEEVI